MASIPKGYVEKYGLLWPPQQNPLALELRMIHGGGQWKNRYGVEVGNGLAFHFKEAMKLLWPEAVWHAWLDLFVENYVSHTTVVVIGPASSGKTFSAALCALVDYYAHPRETSIIICSTTMPRLEDRIWGEIKKMHRQARERHRWLPGHLIEGLHRLITDPRKKAIEGRDFRDGIVGVPALRGDSVVGLGAFAGIKNKRVRLIADELPLLPRIVIDAISNLDKNPDFKFVGLGNPIETTDPLGVIAEPDTSAGGWDGGIDQEPKTKTWKTRRPKGICIQLVGSDSPNLDGKLGIPLITQEQIDRDLAFYGPDSEWYTTMDQGMMPRGQGSKRVLTLQTCRKFRAFDKPHWLGTKLMNIAFLDAAYGGVGGDRCVFGTLSFGLAVPDNPIDSVVPALVSQEPVSERSLMVAAITSLEIVPLNPKLDVLITDQIASFVMRRCETADIPPQNFFFDSGMRSALVSAFCRLWSPSVCPIDFGGPATDRQVSEGIKATCSEHYSKFVTELWFSVAYIVEAGQFRGMTEAAGIEFSSRRWAMVSGNRKEVEPKWKMKETAGRSPDLADAIACGIEGARQRGFVIQKLGNGDARPPDDRWKRKLREQASALHRGAELNPNA